MNKKTHHEKFDNLTFAETNRGNKFNGIKRNNRVYKVNKITRQKGFTLTELIISTGLGIFLSAALTQVYLSSAQTDTLVHQQSLIQENARFAFRFVGENVMHAGFSGSIRELDNALVNTSIPFNDLGIIFSDPGHVVIGYDDAGDEDIRPSGERENTDQLFIRYQGIQAGAGEDAPLTDCLGVALADREIVQIRYYLGEGSDHDSLLCASYIEGRSKAYQSQPLIDNVKNLQFLYGLDLNNDGAVNIFVPASDSRLNGGENSWNKVAAIKMQISLQSDNKKFAKEFSEIIRLRNRHI